MQKALYDNIVKPKELWKTLQGLGLKTSNKTSQNICLQTEGKLSFDPKANANIFKNFFCSLAETLVKELPKAKKLFGIESVKSYYKKYKLQDKKFYLTPVNEEYIQTLLSNINISKTAGIDNIAGRFLKDGAPKLSIIQSFDFLINSTR